MRPGHGSHHVQEIRVLCQSREIFVAGVTRSETSGRGTDASACINASRDRLVRTSSRCSQGRQGRSRTPKGGTTLNLLKVLLLAILGVRELLLSGHSAIRSLRELAGTRRTGGSRFGWLSISTARHYSPSSESQSPLRS